MGTEAQTLTKDQTMRARYRMTFVFIPSSSKNIHVSLSHSADVESDPSDTTSRVNVPSEQWRVKNKFHSMTLTTTTNTVFQQQLVDHHESNGMRSGESERCWCVVGGLSSILLFLCCRLFSSHPASFLWNTRFLPLSTHSLPQSLTH